MTVQLVSKPSKYATVLVVAGGMIWVVSGIAYGAIIAACFPSCSSQVLANGIANYPAQAVRDLAWEDFYSLLYAAVIGLLTISIGLKPFRQGQMWAWYATLIVAVAGILTGLLDYVSWGGWYTFLFLGLPAVLGLVISTPAFFPSERSSTKGT